MDYKDGRSQIKTGDLIGVLDSHGLLGLLTRFFTRSPYTHTGVAIWLGERLFMADLNSGRNHLTAVSCLKNFDVCNPPEGLDAYYVWQSIFEWLAKPINYGVLAFLAIGLRCFLGLKFTIHWKRIMVCSGGSVNIYELTVDAMQRAGMKVPLAWEDHNRMLSPGELVEELGPPKLRIRA